MRTFVIENEYQKITILNYGATIHTWEAFRDKINIVISNKNIEDYLVAENGHMGATIGRVANRIDDAKFTLNNKTYYLDMNFYPVSGHGGDDGFFCKKFEVVEHTNNLLVLNYLSKHLESNYPGNLDVTVTYKLDNNKLTINYDANTDQDTLLNITNHAYFNLSNEEDILNHKIYASTSKTLETDNNFIPTGEYVNNIHNVLNLNQNKYFYDIINNKDVLAKADGLDHFFIFDQDKKNKIVLSYKNRNLTIETKYPGFQLYTFQSKVCQPLLNRVYKKYIGAAFEASFEPDAINHKNFSNIILKKDDTYKQSITYTIGENFNEEFK